jgi:hypothetical protein
MMPFSLSSYLLGVGTVVGALAFGFGGGVLLTNTAMKETSATPTRVERLARAEPQAVEAKVVPGAPAESTPPPAPQVQASTDSDGPVANVPREARPANVVEEPATQTEPTKQAEPAKQPDVTKQIEPTKQADPSRQAEQKEVDQRKTVERKIERQKRYADRKTRDMAPARTKPHQFEEQRESPEPEFAVEREEPRFRPFELPLFGRSREMSPADRED